MRPAVPLGPDSFSGRPRISRRAFIFGWFPFFHRKYVTIAGIRFRVIRHGKSKRRYLLIHGNEETAREVLTEHMRTHDGIAHLVTGHDRYVPVDGGRFDPNRIFSREGAAANLRMLNPEWTLEQINAALARFDHDRPKLVRTLLPPIGGLLVALHNNSEGYSVRDEVPISDQVSLKQPGSPNEFFLCTDPADFRVLAGSPYNAVLQNKIPLQDDGSLSRLCARHSVRYLNLEVGLGKAPVQREMLDWAETHLA